MGKFSERLRKIPNVKADERANADAFATRIEEMLDSGEYEWARETLAGILQSVVAGKYCTENQIKAVDNIEEGGERGREARDYGSGRDY